MNKYQEELFGIYQEIGEPYEPLLLIQQLVDIKTKIYSIDLDKIQKGCNYLNNKMYYECAKPLQQLLDILMESD